MSIDELKAIKERFEDNDADLCVDSEQRRILEADIDALITEIERLCKALGDCEAWARHAANLTTQSPMPAVHNIIKRCERTLK